MIQNPTNQKLSDIGNTVVQKFMKYEIPLALFFVFFLILKMSTELPASVFITLILSSLAILYYFSAFAIPNEKADKVELFINKIAFIGCSVTLIGMLFKLQSWQGNNIMLWIGCTVLIILIPSILLIKSKKNDLEILNQKFIMRIVIIAVIGLLLSITSRNDLLKYKLIKEIKIEHVRDDVSPNL